MLSTREKVPHCCSSVVKKVPRDEKRVDERTKRTLKLKAGENLRGLTVIIEEEKAYYVCY